MYCSRLLALCYLDGIKILLFLQCFHLLYTQFYTSLFMSDIICCNGIVYAHSDQQSPGEQYNNNLVDYHLHLLIAPICSSGKF